MTEERAVADRKRWDDHAKWWQDEFTDGADPEYEEQILPLIAGQFSTRVAEGSLVADIGAGEGQVARLLTSLGHHVVALDPSMAQTKVCAERGGGVETVQGSADTLPFRSGSLDAALACLVFEHIADVVVALTEVTRIVRPGGHFMLLLNHPLIQTPDSGWIEDYMVDPPLRYWQLGPYLTEATTIEQVQAGVFIRFYHRPLSKYLNTAAQLGWRLEEFIEPAPPQGFIDRAPEYQNAVDMPRLLALVFRRDT